MKKLHPAYVAGLFDGEGCVSIGGYDKCRLQLEVANTHLPVLLQLKTQYKGSVQPTKKAVPQARQCYKWYVTGKSRSQSFLLEILPHLVIKREQVEHALALLSLIGDGTRVPEEAWDKRYVLAEAIRTLNQGKGKE